MAKTAVFCTLLLLLQFLPQAAAREAQAAAAAPDQPPGAVLSPVADQSTGPNLNLSPSRSPAPNPNPNSNAAKTEPDLQQEQEQEQSQNQPPAGLNTPRLLPEPPQPPVPPPPGALNGRPKPRGFEGVDERMHAPMGFYQNRADNSIKSLKEHGQDGDYAVIEGVIAEYLGDECYLLQDKTADTIKICRSEETVPADLQLQTGGEYIFWVQVDKSLFSLSLDVLLMAEN